MEIQVPVIHTEEDATSFVSEVVREQTLRNPQIRRMGAAVRIFSGFFLVVAFGAILFFRIAGYAPPPESIVLFLFSVVLFIGAVIFEHNLMYFLIRSAKKEVLAVFQSEASAMHRGIFTFNDEEMCYATAGGQERIAWNSLERVDEFPSFFVFRPGPGRQFLLPRRCFSGREQLDDFFALLERAAPGSALSFRHLEQRQYAPDSDFFQEDGADALEILRSTGSGSTQHARFDLVFERTEDEVTPILYETVIRGRNYRRVAAIAFTVLLFGTLGVFLLPWSAARNFSLFLVLSGVLLLAGLIFFTIKLVISARDEGKALPRFAHLRFFADRFQLIYSRGTREYEWSGVQLVRIREKDVTIWITDGLVVNVPLRVVHNDTEKSDFLQYLKSTGARVVHRS